MENVQLDCDLCESAEKCKNERTTSTPFPYRCTREPGHDGPHAACGVTENAHPIAEWEQTVDGHV